MSDFAALRDPHRAFDDGCSWALTDSGISIDGAPAAGTPGEPMTVRRVWAWFGDAIRSAALQYGVPAEAIVATICAESAGGALARFDSSASTRHEPGYVSDDATPNKVSIGCMQTLISTARAALEQPDLTGADLLDPMISVSAGTAYMAEQATHTAFDPPKMAAAYNAGSLRWDGGDNPWRMACYPLGTGAHVTRWVAFFNDAMRVSREQPDMVAGVLSYTTAA